jgi:lipopolysaccharide export LptBFGC system permease protein LptF
MRILQWYIFRELFKAMVMTTIGMTLLFTLGGGVANMVKGVAVSTEELAQLLGYMLPVACTLTLPVAALLSTTSIYGRVSADNEFNACRASGINIHRLLLPAILVSLAVGAFTFYFSNYVIPSFIKQIEVKAKQGIDQYVNRQLQSRKYIEVSNYVLHADGVQHVSGQTIGEASSGKDLLLIDGAAFIELEEDDAIRFGTAPRAMIEFDKTGGPLMVRAQLMDVSVFDRVRLQYYENAKQQFGPMELPIPIQMKAKWLNLSDLFHYRDQPGELPEILHRLKGVQRKIRERVCYDDILRGVASGQGWRASSDRYSYEVKAEEYRRNPEDGRPLLRNVTVIQDGPEGRRIHKAGAGAMRTTRSFGESVPLISIVLTDGVRVSAGDASEPPIEKMMIDLPPVPIPDQCVRAADAVAEELVRNPEAELNLGQQIADERDGVIRELAAQVRVIDGIIHSRLAFSASCIVLILLGAGLGIVSRGGQALVAFGLSCIPFVFVIVTITMGRHMAQNEGTETAGLIIIWTSIGLVALADLLVLFKWLRR